MKKENFIGVNIRNGVSGFPTWANGSGDGTIGPIPGQRPIGSLETVHVAGFGRNPGNRCLASHKTAAKRRVGFRFMQLSTTSRDGQKVSDPSFEPVRWWRRAPCPTRWFALALLAVVLGATGACHSGPKAPFAALAFISNRDGNPELYTANSNGTGQKRLTITPGTESAPVFSSKHDLIAYIYTADGKSNLYLMHADGRGQKKISPVVGTTTSAFAWGPQGRRIAYVAASGSATQIYIYDIATAKSMQLTNDEMTKELGSWSPDGKWVAYAVTAPSADTGIYKKNPDGVNKIRLTDKADFDPRWSPDGKKIAFQSRRDGNLEIYVMKQDGQNAVNVTKAPGEDRAPQWSPDSSLLAFVSQRDGNPEIYVVSPDGKNTHRLTHNNADDEGPRWSPDGREIIFSSNVDGDY